MRTIKPLQTSLLHKCFDWKGEPRFAISVLIGFEFGEAQAMLEPDLWKFLGEALKDDGVMLDMCMPKPRGEVVVYGSYFSPGGQPVTADRVKVELGEINKELAVFGDRYWRTLMAPSSPEPFSVMPLTYNLAFGGKDYTKNPLGKGLDKIDVFGEMRLPLPNIELPNKLISSSSAEPDPAGFRPLDLMWQPRASRTGTYDDKWIAEVCPAYPHDLDWTFFNVSPKDQWLDDYFKGGEQYSITNMHPEKPILSGKLPSYRVRCFFDQKLEESTRFREIETNLETVFLFPEQEKGVLLYRGTVTISEDDASDIDNIVVAYEGLEHSPRSQEHYEQALRKRLDPKEGFKYMLTSKDMIPLDEQCGYARLMAEAEEPELAMLKNITAKSEALKSEALERIEADKNTLVEKMKSEGIDPQSYIQQIDDAIKGSNKSPELDEIMAIMDKVAPGINDPGGQIELENLDFGKMDELKSYILQMADEKKSQAKALLQNQLEQLQNKDNTAQVVEQLENAILNIDKPPQLPRINSSELIDNIRRQVLLLQEQKNALKRQGTSDNELAQIDVDIEKIERDVVNGAEEIKRTYRMGAHMMEQGSLPHEQPADIMLYRFKKSLEKGSQLAGGDYAGLDLSGMDLSGIDLSDCYLEQVNFSGAKLVGANLENAILVRSNLMKADLSNANCEGANLGSCQLQNANFSDANLKKAILSKSNLSGAKFIRCNMQGITEFIDVIMNNVDMSESVIEKAAFIELDIKGGIFCKAHLTKCTFVKCNMASSNFSEATLLGSIWVESDLDCANFSGANMQATNFPGECSLQQARFTGANVSKSGLRNTNLAGADFTSANFEMSDFGGANLQKACFYRAIGKGAQFIKADLTGANMSSMNLMNGTLMKALLTSADFSYSNLYGVEFMNATVGGTDFSHANLDMSKLQDWRPSK
jgi:uncharacterized protein YjbI with pentapeptide repeats